MKGLRKFSQKFSQRSKGHLQNLTTVWERWSSRKQNQRLTDEGGRVCKSVFIHGRPDHACRKFLRNSLKIVSSYQ